VCVLSRGVCAVGCLEQGASSAPTHRQATSRLSDRRTASHDLEADPDGIGESVIFQLGVRLDKSCLPRNPRIENRCTSNRAPRWESRSTTFAMWCMANDGVITTFAVVAGVTGGTLAPVTVLVLGVANLLADGLSMGSGTTSESARMTRVREAQRLPEQEAFPIRPGLATFLAFVAAGAVPLLPYVFSGLTTNLFATSTVLSLVVLFGVGAAPYCVRSLWR